MLDGRLLPCLTMVVAAAAEAKAKAEAKVSFRFFAIEAVIAAYWDVIFQYFTVATFL